MRVSEGNPLLPKNTVDATGSTTSTARGGSGRGRSKPRAVGQKPCTKDFLVALRPVGFQSVGLDTA